MKLTCYTSASMLRKRKKTVEKKDEKKGEFIFLYEQSDE